MCSATHTLSTAEKGQLLPSETTFACQGRRVLRSALHGFGPRVRAAEMEEAEREDRVEQVRELVDAGAAYEEIGVCARS
ncbi:hypothetical protein [Streptomyces parvus]|uniref:hypothetical protein n=1 Tax=Streptomyces parvus TaxID=66428 RepID=UPI00340A9AFD